MTDACTLLRKLLLADSTFAALIGTNGQVVAGNLPQGADPAVNKFVTLQAQGGNSHPEIETLQEQRILVKCWGGVNGQEAAAELYQALRAAVHGVQNKSFSTFGFIRTCLEVVAGQDITDPDTGWATVAAFYEVSCRS
jgi:hypothetical protein